MANRQVEICICGVCHTALVLLVQPQPVIRCPNCNRELSLTKRDHPDDDDA